MKPYLNLLPPVVRSRLLLRRRTREWAYRGMLLGALTLCSLGAVLRQWTSASQELELWKRRAATVEEIDAKNRRLFSKIGLLERRLDKYRNLQTERLGYQLLSTLSHSSRGTQGEMQIRKLALKLVETTISPPVKNKNAVLISTRSYLLSVMGAAKTNLHIAQFASALRDSGAFERVDLKSSRGAPRAGESEGERLYHLECTF
jgi:hypothetical protein